MPDNLQQKSNAHIMHLSIAEYGKLCLIKGDVGEALRHFREAIQLSVSAKAPEVFFRHYTHCVLEALEKAGNFDEVEDYCRRADAHYQQLDLDSALLRKDHGATVERLALMLLLKSDDRAARAEFSRAVEIAGKGKLPLSEALLGWLQRGLAITRERLRQMQSKHDYFLIEKSSVNEAIATPLPPQAARRSPASMLG
ncbi:MAG: peptidylprolyl isomerase [Sphingomonadales bacterium]|nr:peptidylprolyl isomerase [Sphingomonadales bacterium]